MNLPLRLLTLLALLNFSASVFAKVKPKDNCTKLAEKVLADRNPKLGDFVVAEKACATLVQPTCEATTKAMPEVRGGDAELVTMACALRVNYAANRKLGNGKATPECKEAFSHIYTANTSKAEDSAAICFASNTAICAAKASDLEKGKCRVDLAFTAYRTARSDSSFKMTKDEEAAADAMSKKEADEFTRLITDGKLKDAAKALK